MHPRQHALLRGAVDALVAECLRSPVATLNVGHLRALLVDHLLRGGASLLERGATSGEARLLRLVGDVLRVERYELPRRATRARAPRPADVRVSDPVALAIDLHARGTLSAPDRLGSQALLDRFAALGAGTSDVLVLACDRRAFDALRVARTDAGGERPTALSRLAGTLLPASADLTPGADPGENASRLSGRTYHTLAAITPMVFGAQRVVAAVWPAARAAEPDVPVAQLDAFELLASS